MELLPTDEIASRHGLVEVLQQTQRLIIFMTNIDVRANVTVDEIVPVTLTNEERLTQVRKQTNETKALFDLINDTLSATSSAKFNLEIVNKVRPALEQSSTSLQKIELLLAADPVDTNTVEIISLETYNLIFDAAQLLSIATSNVIEKVEGEKIDENEINSDVEEGTSTPTVTDKVE
jgi:Na+/H+ antiporter NhaB